MLLMDTQTDRGSLLYVGLGMIWPAVLAFAFLMFVPDPRPTWPQIVYSLLLLGLVFLTCIFGVFVTLWLVCLFFAPKVAFSLTRLARLFFWTSLIVSPLALLFPFLK